MRTAKHAKYAKKMRMQKNTKMRFNHGIGSEYMEWNAKTNAESTAKNAKNAKKIRNTIQLLKHIQNERKGCIKTYLLRGSIPFVFAFFFAYFAYFAVLISLSVFRELIISRFLSLWSDYLSNDQS